MSAITAVAAVLRPVADRVSAMTSSSETVRLAPDGVDGWAWQQNTLQSIQAWHSVSDWIDAVNPSFQLHGHREIRAGNVLHSATNRGSPRNPRRRPRHRLDEVSGRRQLPLLPHLASGRAEAGPAAIRQAGVAGPHHSADLHGRNYERAAAAFAPAGRGRRSPRRPLASWATAATTRRSSASRWK